MSQQIQLTGGAKVRNLQDVIIGTSGVLSSLAFDVANGVPKLDSNGKILVSQLPNSVMEYKGTWNAATNTPTLANGTGNQGDVYLCNVAGTVDFGAGPIAFVVGDQVIYSGSIWQRASGATGTVTSVAITESGDSLNITGSPITTSGTINIGFNGTNLQYVNGAGNLTTFPILTGYVPYTGATANVDLGVFDLTADLITGATGSFASSGGSDTFAINHSSGSGIALNITKGGNGEGLYINKTSGSGNAVTIIGTLEATTLVKNGGTSSQFLKADGTVDSSTYALDSLVVHLAGTETITGAKTFSGYTTFTSTVDITSGLTFSNSGFTLLLQPPTLSVNRTVTLPNGTGTIALTSDISYPVTSVFGRTGAVVATSGDYTTAQVTESGNLYFTDSRARLALSFVAGSGAYNSTTGVITIPTNNNQITNGAGYTTNVGTVTSVAALTLGTSGTDLSSTVATGTTTPVITLNVPTASATNRGALSSADWTTFNNKQSALTNPVTGTGTTNYLPKFTGTSTIGNSIVSESGSTINIAGNIVVSGGNNLRVLTTTNATTGFQYADFLNTSGRLVWGINGSAANGLATNSLAYGGVIYADNTLQLGVNGDMKMTLNASGNLGLGVTPSAWGVSYKAVQIANSALWAATNDLHLTLNTLYDGAYKYIDSGYATRYNQYLGQHIWYTAPSGTAGNAISFTQAMTLTASGRLLIGTPTEASYLLDVNGTGRFSGVLSVFVGGNDTRLANFSTSTYGSARGLRINSYQSSNGGQDCAIEFDSGVATYGGFKFSNSGTPMLTLVATGAATFSSSVTASSLRVDNNSNLIGNGRRIFGNDDAANYYIGDIGGTGGLTINWYGGIIMRTFDTERMRITSGGDLYVKGNGSDITLSTRIYSDDTYSDFLASATSATAKTMRFFAKNTLETMRITSGGVLQVANGSGTLGTIVGSERLNVNGDVYAYGKYTGTSFFESSDMRIKTLIQDNYQTKGIASITPKLYTKNGKVELGYYAQDFVGILDSAVSKGSDEMLSLSYREVLVAKVYALEQRIKELETK